jgi:hypothetical protein
LGCTFWRFSRIFSGTTAPAGRNITGSPASPLFPFFVRIDRVVDYSSPESDWFARPSQDWLSWFPQSLPSKKECLPSSPCAPDKKNTTLDKVVVISFISH